MEEILSCSTYLTPGTWKIMMDLYCVNLANQTIFPKYSLPCIVSLDHMRHPCLRFGCWKWSSNHLFYPGEIATGTRCYFCKVTHITVWCGVTLLSWGSNQDHNAYRMSSFSLSDFWVRCILKSLIKGVIFCFRKPLSSELEAWI